MDLDKMRVLFVCIKNSARSVMAEAIFNNLARKWKAESAGLQKAERIDEKTKEVLKKHGLKAKEKPRSVEEVNLEDYDLIVTVCDESCVLLPAKKLLRWQIEDPVGKDDEAYERVFENILINVERLIKDLEG